MVTERERAGSAAKGVKGKSGIADWKKSGRIDLELPFPPSVNRYWRHVVIGGKGRTLISADGRVYKLAVSEAVNAARSAIGTKDRLSVAIDVYPPENRRRDLDNLLKGLLDSLTSAGVWEDDSQIDELSISRCPVEAGGRCVVHISTLEDE